MPLVRSLSCNGINTTTVRVISSRDLLNVSPIEITVERRLSSRSNRSHHWFLFLVLLFLIPVIWLFIDNILFCKNLEITYGTTKMTIMNAAKSWINNFEAWELKIFTRLLYIIFRQSNKLFYHVLRIYKTLKIVIYERRYLIFTLLLIIILTRNYTNYFTLDLLTK